MDLIEIIDSIILRIKLWNLPLNDNAWDLVSSGVCDTLIHNGIFEVHFKISFGFIRKVLIYVV